MAATREDAFVVLLQHTEKTGSFFSPADYTGAPGRVKNEPIERDGTAIGSRAIGASPSEGSAPSRCNKA